MLQDHGHGASASRGVPVYAPAFADTKLHCLVTEADWCEQLAQGCYSTARQLALKLVTIESQARYPTQHIVDPQKAKWMLNCCY